MYKNRWICLYCLCEYDWEPLWTLPSIAMHLIKFIRFARECFNLKSLISLKLFLLQKWYLWKHFEIFCNSPCIVSSTMRSRNQFSWAKHYLRSVSNNRRRLLQTKRIFQFNYTTPDVEPDHKYLTSSYTISYYSFPFHFSVFLCAGW